MLGKRLSFVPNRASRQRKNGASAERVAGQGLKALGRARARANPGCRTARPASLPCERAGRAFWPRRPGWTGRPGPPAWRTSISEVGGRHLVAPSPLCDHDHTDWKRRSRAALQDAFETRPPLWTAPPPRRFGFSHRLAWHPASQHFAPPLPPPVFRTPNGVPDSSPGLSAAIPPDIADQNPPTPEESNTFSGTPSGCPISFNRCPEVSALLRPPATVWQPFRVACPHPAGDSRS